MKTKRILYTVLLLFVFSGQSLAQKAAIRITNFTIGVGCDSVHVGFELSAAGLSSDYRMDLNPVLYSVSNHISLDPVRISGRRNQRLQQRGKLYDRKSVKGRGIRNSNPLYEISVTDTLHYQVSLPFESWMSIVSLRVDGRLTGCCSSVIMPSYEAVSNLSLCPLQEEIAEVSTVVDSIPTAVLCATERLAVTEKFICPITEYVADKQAGMYHRNQAALRIYFRQSYSRMDTTYCDNGAVLHRFEQALQVMQADTTVRITRILIVGYASIEGTASMNERLAAQRAACLKDFAVVRGISASCIETVNMGEGWDELRDLVVESNVEAREEVLRIIDNVPVMNGREKQLMDLRGGKPYRWMMEHLFPLQRNAGYVKIYYEKTN